MRRVVFLTLGLLELAVATGLIVFGILLDPTGVGDGFVRAEQVTRKAGTQVQLVRAQVQDLRRPEVSQLAERLQAQTRSAAAVLEAQQVDYDTVQSMADALGDVAAGLDGLADTLRSDQFGKLGDGLGETAAFLERIMPTAAKAADDLDATTTALRADALRLDVLLRASPLDFKAAREIHDSLARFGEGLDRMNRVLKLERLQTMREGFEGMETSLSTGAEQVDRLSGYSYPAVVMKGFKPQVTQRPFWPEGGEIAKGLRKAASGVTAAGKEMDSLADDLPRLRTSLDESRKVVDKTREALSTALQHQDELEPLLKDLPAKAAQVADNLPRLSADLARVLRDTHRLKEVATALRQGQQALDMAVSHWPELRRTLARSSTLLKATHTQLQQVLRNRDQYEAARQEAVHLGESFATMLPLLTDQMHGHLREQDYTLGDLSQSIYEVADLMPVYGQMTQRLLLAGRYLAWLMAGIIGLHGAYLALSGRIGRRCSV
jgi:uncharacterized phage infection (PIP) family protein YhgE